MCMKYEENYGTCFDAMEGWGYNDDESLHVFLGKYGVKVDDKNALLRQFFDVLALCHETGAIRPMTEEEEITFRTEQHEEQVDTAMNVYLIPELRAKFDARVKKSEEEKEAYLKAKNEQK